MLLPPFSRLTALATISTTTNYSPTLAGLAKLLSLPLVRRTAFQLNPKPRIAEDLE